MARSENLGKSYVRKEEQKMMKEVITGNKEAAIGLVNTLLEDEVIKDFEIWELTDGSCKVVFWMLD